MKIYTSNVLNNNKNKGYPIEVDVFDEDSLIKAVSHDYVCAKYKNNQRSIENFIESDVVAFDCDNTDSDDPLDWVDLESLEAMFSDVEYYLHMSKNNMVDKVYDNKIVNARPRFHIFFPIKKITDSKKYSELKSSVIQKYPIFDSNAIDAARFFFGTEKPTVVYHYGKKKIDEVVEELDKFEKYCEDNSPIPEIIPIGSRNNTLTKIAAKMVKKSGVGDEVKEAFMKLNERCEEPMSDWELNVIWNSAVGFFNRVIKNQDGYIPPEEYKNKKSLAPEEFNDMGQAAVLESEYGHKLIYVKGFDFLVNVGTHWKESDEHAALTEMSLVKRQIKEADKMREDGIKKLEQAGYHLEDILADKKMSTSDEAKLALSQIAFADNYKKFALKRGDYRYITSALDTAKSYLIKEADELDGNPYLLNTKNGTVDLRTGVLYEHNPEDYITKICNVGLENGVDEKGRILWNDALDVFFEKDAELINYVQEVVGLAAIGKVTMECLIIAHGDGRNGKSTFWNTILRVLGSYGGMISADALTVGCKRNIKPELAELKGKRLVIAAELEEGTRLNTSIVKQLSSTDEIHAEKKFKPPFKFIPTHLTVLYTNHLPRVGALDDGTWRRLIVIPFNAKIEGSSDIKNYGEYLIENAGGYILKWIIEGAMKVIKNGGKVEAPKVVLDATAKYREDNNWINIFLEECCDLDKSYSEKSGELYNEYKNYCSQNGEYTRSTTDFYGALENKGLFRVKKHEGKFIMGLRLKTGF